MTDILIVISKKRGQVLIDIKIYSAEERLELEILIYESVVYSLYLIMWDGNHRAFELT